MRRYCAIIGVICASVATKKKFTREIFEVNEKNFLRKLLQFSANKIKRDKRAEVYQNFFMNFFMRTHDTKTMIGGE